MLEGANTNICHQIIIKRNNFLSCANVLQIQNLSIVKSFTYDYSVDGLVGRLVGGFNEAHLELDLKN